METLTEEVVYDHPRPICWGAILGGWIVATAVALLFYAVGTALGINVIQAAETEALGKKAIIATGIWLLLTWAAALYLGGLFSGRAVRGASVRTGALHATGVWALSTVLTAFIGISGAGVTGLTGILAAGQAGKTAGAGLLAAAPFAASALEKNPEVPADFLAKLKYGVNDIAAKRLRTGAAAAQTPDTQTLNRGFQELDAKTLMTIGADFLGGDKTAAKNSLSVNTSLTSQEAQQIVDSLSAQTDEIKARLKKAAEKAALYTSAALWASVLISLLSLQAAVMGGRAGTGTCCAKAKETAVYEPIPKM